MTATTDPAGLAAADLAGHAPQLVAGFHAALPRAVDSVGRKLLGAAWREDIGQARATLRPARRYGFDRVAVPGPVHAWPAPLLRHLGVDSPGLAGELSDACVNLAVAYARRPAIDAGLCAAADAAGVPDLYGLAAGLPGDDQLALFERLATEGHNLHPCGRTRLGWRVPDVLAHDLESPATGVRFVAVRHDLHAGEDVGQLLRDRYPRLPAPPSGYRLHPVHAWQYGAVLADRYPQLFAERILVALPDAALAAVPTSSLRTVLLEPDATGARPHLKLSLDIQVTSTRRSISVASTRNGPVISALLLRLLDGEESVLLMPETAGAAVPAAGRDAAVIVRGGLAGLLRPGEVAVPGSALVVTSPITGRSVLAEALDRSGAGPLDFLAGYARLLLPPLLRLAAAGVGLEAHLQNSIPVLRDGVPVRIAFRDFAGLRLHLPRLAARAPGGTPRLWPGSVVGTDDVDVMLAKLGYTAVQAHLGELVVHLCDGYQVAERDAWRAVRGVLEEARGSGRVEPGDVAFLTAPTVPHKALTRMRLSGDGDCYVPVHNPLHGV
jgi:siderophore synthetase component